MTDALGLPAAAGRHRSWCTIDIDALAANLRELRKLSDSRSELAAVVKANAYGHGIELAARAFRDAGADALCVDALSEAEVLRRTGYEGPLYLLGYLPPADAELAVELATQPTVYNPDQVVALGRAARRRQVEVLLELKLETGTHRQGLDSGDAIALADLIANTAGVTLDGVTSHFANIEDTTDHAMARRQLARFDALIAELEDHGHVALKASMANSAATILWREAHRDRVRPGISLYGMWPSTETLVAAARTGRHRLELRPALSWETIVAQVKSVPAGADVGYGCTYRTTHDSRLAILPIGYYDGYDRRLSNLAHVLIDGQRAPLRGRVCMNMVMIDVTHIQDVHPGTRVVLLGTSGEEQVSAEQMAAWSQTINYEVTTRIRPGLPRIPRTTSPGLATTA